MPAPKKKPRHAKAFKADLAEIRAIGYRAWEYHMGALLSVEQQVRARHAQRCLALAAEAIEDLVREAERIEGLRKDNPRLRP
jgi:hypothetical protein